MTRNNKNIQSTEAKLFLLDEIKRSKITFNYGVIVFLGIFINGSVALFHGLISMSILFYLLCSCIILIPFLNRANKTSTAVTVLIHTSNISILFFNLTFTHDMMYLYYLFPLFAGISYLNPLPRHRNSLVAHTIISVLFHIIGILIFVFYMPQKPTDYSFIYIKNGGIIFSLLLTASLIHQHNKKTQRKHNKLEQQIQKNKKVLLQQESILKDKNMLMAEIHHRVKNNLAVVSGMLNWQKSHSDEKLVHEVLNECSNRVMTMALVHKKLYERGDFNEVALNDYVKELCVDIKNTQETNVQLEINVDAEPIFIKIDKATPCGLIINEVMTNCIKHAFVKKYGVIDVSLRLYKNIVVLIIKDNGVGMPPIEEVKNRNTMGYNLIASLSEQIDGKFEYVNANGTQFALHFPLN